MKNTQKYIVKFKNEEGKQIVKPFTYLRSEARPFAQECLRNGTLISLTNSKNSKINL